MTKKEKGSNSIGLKAKEKKTVKKAVKSKASKSVVNKKETKEKKEHPIQNLNDKQKSFCEEYIIDLNATQAAVRAGYSEKTARQAASRMLSHVNIQKYLAELKQKRVERLEITQDFVLKNLVEVLMGCKKEVPIVNAKGQVIGEGMYDPKAANKSIELLGSHVDLFIKKTDITSKGEKLDNKIEFVIREE